MKRNLILVLLSVMLSTSVASAQNSQSFEIGSWFELQNYILKTLEKSYVDTLPLHRMKLAAINAMLKELDPYTVYVPEENVEDFDAMLTNTYGGIGAIIQKEEGENLIIDQPYMDSPAYKAGIESGDEIFMINGEDVTNLTSKDCSSRLKGTPGTYVELLVKKVYTSDTLRLQVKREEIRVSDVAYSEMIAPGVGLIVQSGFIDGTAAEMRKIIEDFQKQGMKKLILDLRENGGGLITEAAKVVSLFVPKNTLVVYSKNRDGEVIDKYYTTEDPVDTNVELYVMVDGYSASASEIVAGALQDLGRAKIVGTRTYGKGSVQRVMYVPYGGELKMTIAFYYTPKGRSVQLLKGLEPDIKIEEQEFSDIFGGFASMGLISRYALEYKRKNSEIGLADEFEFIEYEDFKAFVRPFIKDMYQREIDLLDMEEFVPYIEAQILCKYYYHKEYYKRIYKYDKQLHEFLPQICE